MKNKKFLCLLTLLILVPLIGTITIFATGTSTEPTLSIDKFNLSFSDSIYIKYAVKIDGVDTTLLGDDFQMLFWTVPQSIYEKGTEASSIVSTDTQTINGQKYYIFDYKKLAAKQMTDANYARAYLLVDGKAYYSEVE